MVFYSFLKSDQVSFSVKKRFPYTFCWAFLVKCRPFKDYEVVKSVYFWEKLTIETITVLLFIQDTSPRPFSWSTKECFTVKIPYINPNFRYWLEERFTLHTSILSLMMQYFPHKPTPKAFFRFQEQVIWSLPGVQLYLYSRFSGLKITYFIHANTSNGA